MLGLGNSVHQYAEKQRRRAKIGGPNIGNGAKW